VEEILNQMGWTIKKVLNRSKEKMHKKWRSPSSEQKKLVNVRQHYGVSFYKKIFSLL